MLRKKQDALLVGGCSWIWTKRFWTTLSSSQKARSLAPLNPKVAAVSWTQHSKISSRIFDGKGPHGVCFLQYFSPEGDLQGPLPSLFFEPNSVEQECKKILEDHEDDLIALICKMIKLLKAGKDMNLGPVDFHVFFFPMFSNSSQLLLQDCKGLR